MWGSPASQMLGLQLGAISLYCFPSSSSLGWGRGLRTSIGLLTESQLGGYL